MSFSQFKWIDLFLFSFVALIFEVINRFAAISIFDNFKLIFMSFTIVLTLISMYRWGISGLIVTFFAKLIAVAISTHNNDIRFYVSYVIGGMLGALLGYVIFQLIIGKKRIKHNVLIVIYLICDFAFVLLFESILFSFFNMSTFNETFVSNMKGLLVQECMSLFTSTIILLVANRKKGNILIEMKKYVKDVQDLKKLGGLKEIKESPKFNSDGPFTEFDQIDEGNILDGGTLDVDQLKELENLYEESGKIDKEKKDNCLKRQEKKDK